MNTINIKLTRYLYFILFYFFNVRFLFAQLEVDSPNDFVNTNPNDVRIARLCWVLGVFIKSICI